MSMNVGGPRNDQQAAGIGQTRMGVMEYLKACKTNTEWPTGKCVANAIKFLFSSREVRGDMATQVAPAQRATITPVQLSYRDGVRDDFESGVKSFNEQNRNGKFNAFENVIAFCKLTPEEFDLLCDNGHEETIGHMGNELQGRQASFLLPRENLNLLDLGALDERCGKIMAHLKELKG